MVVVGVEVCVYSTTLGKLKARGCDLGFGRGLFGALVHTFSFFMFGVLSCTLLALLCVYHKKQTLLIKKLAIIKKLTFTYSDIGPPCGNQ